LDQLAKTGDPTGGGLPQWRPYTGASEQYMEFGNDGASTPAKVGGQRSTAWTFPS